MSNSYGFLHVVQAIHGDALMLEFDKGQSSVFMLVDGGPGQSYDRNGDDYSTTDNLFRLLTDLSNRSGQRRLEFIDTVVVTHDDEDHKNGMF
ncbi:hypothetical protein CPB84DRAFT_796659 [Gymnopilus junonius]|uniref:Uncharacterized protein n=1 Tax=Gymnopilus junonius TaxID=109634 RepID=A0A9P5NSJ5_GYMJU|nr:hypothetical protein CPB84DRAFT_796659 [Gymnopilus junonius]